LKGTGLAREITLILHLFGFGTLVTVTVAGFILDRQYRKAPDLKTKALILKSARPIGLLSPFAILLMLVTGIGNMHGIGVGLFDLAWLAYKIVFFAIAATSGILFGFKARKRGALVHQMAEGKAPADAESLLKGYDSQMALFYVVMPLLLIIIVTLSVFGRLGAQ
jgi:hypothetical protein